MLYDSTHLHDILDKAQQFQVLRVWGTLSKGDYKGISEKSAETILNLNCGDGYVTLPIIQNS
jgi:hypothetical protein